MTDCWVNIMPRGTVHTLHLRPFNLERHLLTNKCQGICRPQIRRSAPGSLHGGPAAAGAGAARIAALGLGHPAAVGNLLLFESWLRHEVAPQPRQGRSNQRKLQLQLVLKVKDSGMSAKASDATMAVFLDLENLALGERCPSSRASTSKGARATTPQGPHRGEEGLLRFRALQGFQARACTKRLRTHRNSARPTVRQNSADIRMVVDALRSVLHERATSTLSSSRAATRIFRPWSANCARTPDRHRRRRQKFDLGSIHQQLR